MLLQAFHCSNEEPTHRNLRVLTVYFEGALSLSLFVTAGQIPSRPDLVFFLAFQLKSQGSGFHHRLSGSSKSEWAVSILVGSRHVSPLL